ncbi:MAG: 2-amino-4-hydroxy-6-hydroxymethyldihydropteridine diphosphokinase [Candidatus Marinimicrobia bacterium]|nr:2-amino-4-hydroxy-6-hydroxymethyldihydropteridine diphosphokinase [Candidatus Neomarinimicrobiota bacterium]
MCKVYISLGSNINPKIQYLYRCLFMINEIDNIEIVNQSNIYETSPMYYLEQDNFLNMVIELSTSIKEDILLDIFKDIECEIGRENKNDNKPRKIDIDILDYNQIIINTNKLILPHPKISERLFVLKPWNDIAPDFILPNQEKTINDLMLLLDSNNNFVKFYSGNNEKNISYSN